MPSTTQTFDATLPWVDALRSHGAEVALHSAGGTISYAVLADRVDDVARRLAGERRLVHVEARSDVASVVNLLAAQRAGHVVLLAAPGAAGERVRDAYSPVIVLTAAGAVEVRREAPAHELHT